MSDSTVDDSTVDDPTRSAERSADSSSTAWPSGAASLLGLWIAVSTTVPDATRAIIWNNALVGAAICLAAGYNYYRLETGRPARASISSLVALLGLWLVASSFVVDAGSGMLVLTNAATGVLIALVASYAGYASSRFHVGVRERLLS